MEVVAVWLLLSLLVGLTLLLWRFCSWLVLRQPRQRRAKPVPTRTKQERADERKKRFEEEINVIDALKLEEHEETAAKRSARRHYLNDLQRILDGT